MKRAFTTLELVFVIVILGILVVIALPKFSSSRDEAEVSKSLNNLKTLINGISIHALKNSHLNTMNFMSNVSGVENVNLNNFIGIREVNFRIREDKKCMKLIFIDRNDFVLMGISSDEASKNAIINIVSNPKQEFQSLDFTSNSKNKTYVVLGENENFKNLASKTCLLVGGV